MRGSLVRYGSSAVGRRAMGALRAGRYGSRARAAYKVGRFIYRNRGKLRTGARMARSAFRNRPRSSRIDTATAKADQYQRYYGDGASANFLMTTLTRKTFFAEQIEFARPPGQNNFAGTAQGLTFGVNGFKLCGIFKNNNESVATNVHLILVQAKQPDITAADLQNDCFRNPQSEVDRYSSFVNFATDPVWDPHQDCLALSKEKFNILTHQRFNLNAIGMGLQDRGSSWKKIEKYFSMKGKCFQFETYASLSPMKPVWLILYHEGQWRTDAATSIEFSVNTVTYLKKNKAAC